MSKVILQCVILTIKTYCPSEDERKNPEGENKKVERTQHGSEVSEVNLLMYFGGSSLWVSGLL